MGRWIGTKEQAELWEKHLVSHPNAIMICWQFWEGFDGLQEKICIAGKIPFANIGDAYTKAKMMYDRNSYNLDTARLLAQSLGRTRRGRPEDYDAKEERRGLVAIADGSWGRIEKYMSPDLKEALVI